MRLMRMIIIHLSVVCSAMLTILIASSDTTILASKHITVAEAIVNTNSLRRLRQLISPTSSSRNRGNSSNTIDTSSKTASVKRFTVQDHPHPHPQPSQELELQSSQLKRCSSNHHRQHRSFHRVKKRIQRIMGQSISTSQWYVYGRRHFTKTGYQRHIKDYNENVQNCANIGRNGHGADGVDLDGKVVVITGYVCMHAWSEKGEEYYCMYSYN